MTDTRDNTDEDSEGIWLSGPNAPQGDSEPRSGWEEYIDGFVLLGDEHERQLIMDFVCAGDAMQEQMDCLQNYCFKHDDIDGSGYAKLIGRYDRILLKRGKVLMKHWSKVRRTERIRVTGPAIGLDERVRKLHALPDDSPLRNYIWLLDENVSCLTALTAMWRSRVENYKSYNVNVLRHRYGRALASSANKELQSFSAVITELEEAKTNIRALITEFVALGPRVEVVHETDVCVGSKIRKRARRETKRRDELAAVAQANRRDRLWVS